MNKRKPKTTYELDFPILFYPHVIGKSFIEMELDVIETSKQNVLGRWYHSVNDADLFLWSDENNNIIKQQMIFSGQVVEWNIIDGLKTGLISDKEHENTNTTVTNDTEDITKITREKNKSIKYDKYLQTLAVSQALDIVQSIESLQWVLKEQLQTNYKWGKKLTDMNPLEVANRFGHHIANKNWFSDLVKKIKSLF